LRKRSSTWNCCRSSLMFPFNHKIGILDQSGIQGNFYGLFSWSLFSFCFTSSPVLFSVMWPSHEINIDVILKIPTKSNLVQIMKTFRSIFWLVQNWCAELTFHVQSQVLIKPVEYEKIEWIYSLFLHQMKWQEDGHTGKCNVISTMTRHIEQGWWICGMHAKKFMQKDFLGMQHSLLYHFFCFVQPA